MVLEWVKSSIRQQNIDIQRALGYALGFLFYNSAIYVCADETKFEQSTEVEDEKKRYLLVCRLLRNVRPATSIATLRCKTVSEQVCHRLADALRSIGPAQRDC